MRTRPFVLASAALALRVLVGAIARADDVAGAAPAAPSGVVFEPGTPAFADVLAKSRAEGKPAFLDFSTEWCGWCRKLEKDTFSQASVAEVMTGFVNVHIDAEKGEGPDLAKRYGVSGFPTLVVVDASGEEVDRIVGYRPPETFEAEMSRILRGEGTLPALRKAYAASEGDVDAGLALATRLADSRATEAAGIFDELAGKIGGRDRETQARFHLERGTVLLGTGRTEDAAAAAEKVVREFGDTAAAPQAVVKLYRAFLEVDVRRALDFVDAARARAKDAEERRVVERVAVTIHRKEIAAALRRQAEAAGDDAQALNEVAWTCFEQQLNVREAIAWARKAAALSEREPAILDTLANLLWLAGARDEAIQLETEAARRAVGAMKTEFSGVLAKWRTQTADGDDADDDVEEEEDDVDEVDEVDDKD